MRTVMLTATMALAAAFMSHAGAQTVTLKGDLGQSIHKTLSTDITMACGETYVVAVKVASEEYPYYTGYASQYNDRLAWDIACPDGQVLAGDMDVNSRHPHWVQSGGGFILEDLRVVSVPPATPGVTTMDTHVWLSVVNIADGLLPSTVIVEVYPLDMGNTHTVTFNPTLGETLVASKPVTTGLPYGMLPTPTHGTHKFLGWFTEATEGTQVLDVTEVTQDADHTLFAQWEHVNGEGRYLSSPGMVVSQLVANCTAGGCSCSSYTCIPTAYSGFVYDENNTVQGVVALSAKATVRMVKDKTTQVTSATTNWAFSAKVTLQTASLSFSSKTADAANLFTATAKSGELLRVFVDGARCYGTLSGGKLGETLHVDGAIDVFADKKDREAQGKLNVVKGLYNVALLDSGLEEVVTPAGFISLTVGNLGAVKLAGKLSDGTAVSGSAKLLAGLSNDGWHAVVLYKPLYTKKGFISGLLWLNPAEKLILTDSNNGWSVNWVCDDLKTGAFNHELDVLGGYFGDGKAGPAVPTGLLFSADVPAGLPPPVLNLTGGMWMGAAFPAGLPVNVNGAKLTINKGVAPKKPAKGDPQEYGYTGFNPSCATLSYTAKTGIFKGRFKLYYDGVNAKGILQHKTSSVSYTGMMVPDGGTLAGFGIGTTLINKQKAGIPVRMD